MTSLHPRNAPGSTSTWGLQKFHPAAELSQRAPIGGHRYFGPGNLFERPL
jgi:hypothetical protein